LLEKEGIGEGTRSSSMLGTRRRDKLKESSGILVRTRAGDDEDEEGQELALNQAKQRTPIRILWSLITTGILILRKKAFG
jgi:hypothetical protein